MKQYIKKRIELFKEKDVRGEVLSNVGLGVFVNALFSITLNQISMLIILDLFFWYNFDN